MARPGRKRAAGTRRSGLFDIVRWELAKTARRRAASSVCLSRLILRSARTSGVSQTRTGVRASRRMGRRYAPHASRRRLSPPPQHEGASAQDRMRVATRSRSRERNVLQSRVVAVVCFRPVPPCYRRPNRATRATPPARISHLHPAAYGQRRGGRLWPAACFPLLFTGKYRKDSAAGVALARCRCRTASLPHACRRGHGRGT